MQPGVYNIPAHTRGDTWEGIPLITVEIDGAPLDLTGGLIEMHVRATRDSAAVVLALSSDAGEITIVDAALGQFAVPAQVIEVASGAYVYDIQITVDGSVYTVLTGAWTITQDVTRA